MDSNIDEKRIMSEETKSIVAYKGFDKNLQCRGFQYEIGKTYTHEGPVKACNSGFHACEYPLDVFSYYAPAGNRFAVVEQGGELSRHDEDSKVASKAINIKFELDLPGIISAAIEYTTGRRKPVDPYSPASATGTQGAASATGTQGVASATGDRGAASATGARGAASATGIQGAALATGRWGVASATGVRGVASATGTQGVASATGDQGAASATGTRGVAMASGYRSRVMGKKGNALFLVFRDDKFDIIHAKAAIVGHDGIKEDVFYMLDSDGNFVEVS